MQKLFLLLCLFVSFNSVAQSTISVLPGTFNTGGGTVQLSNSFYLDWSIGESTVIDTWYGQNVEASARVGLKWNVTSGVLQPFDSIRIFDPNTQFWTANEIRLFPVPTRDVITIDFRSFTTGKINIRLLTMDGKQTGGKEFNQVNGRGLHSFNLKNRSSGTYFFSITLTSPTGQLLKHGIFKFEKIN